MAELTLEQRRAITLARARQRQAAAQQQPPQTSMLEQGTSGLNEGIAGMLGFPGDMLRRGLDAVGIPLAENPTIGGMEIPLVSSSEYWREVLGPTISEKPPQTAPQRIARRVGQDVGAGAVTAPVAGLASLGGLALNTAADAASGLAGGLTAEVTDDPTIQMIASLLAGAGPIAGRAAMRAPAAPSIDDLRARENALYRQIEDSDIRLSPHQAQELQGAASARMIDDGMYPPQHTAARGAVARVYEMPDRSPAGTPSLHDIEDVRQYINANVTPSDVAGEARLGRGLKQEIDAYVNDLPRTNPAAAADVDAYNQAHTTSRRRIAAESVDRQFAKAGWRAASTGTGGNDINAMRQNIRWFLDNPDRLRGFTPEEVAKMTEIVNGTNATNSARYVGSFAPMRGAAAGGFTLGQAYLAGHSGNPAYMLPAGVGMVAQALGETLTRRQIDELSAMIRSGGPVSRSLTDAEKSVIGALTAIQAERQGPQ